MIHTKKKLVTLLLALGMVSAIAVPAFAEPPETDNNDAEIIQPRYGSLYDNIVVSNKSQFCSAPFTTTPGNGDDIRFFFDNTGNSTVRVTLRKEQTDGGWVDCAEQNVTPGNAWHKTYTDGGATMDTYYIVITADGHPFSGELGIAQVP